MTRGAGFSLIEAVVALGVFALGATALLTAAGENARAVGALETKALAGVVAENLISEIFLDDAMPDLGAEAGVVENAGRRWAWRRVVTETPVPEVVQVELEVRLEDGEQVLDSRIVLRTPRQ